MSIGMGGDDMADDGADSNDSTDSNDGVKDLAEIEFRTTDGLRFYVCANLNSTVLSLKLILERKFEFPAPKQRLIHNGRIMEDDQTLMSCGLKGGDTVYFVHRFAPDAPATDVGSNACSRRGRPPFGPSFFPELDPNGPGLANLTFEQMEEQLVQNPNIIRDILHEPAVQDLVNNPEVVRNMIMSNPQLHDVLDRNPELAHILSDPATLQKIMGAARREVRKSNTPNTDPLPNPWAYAAGRKHRNLGASGDPIGNAAANPSRRRFLDIVPNSEPDLTIANETNELMQDPEISETIHNMLSNPQYLNQMLGFNPELQEVLNSRPWIRDVMQNPEFIRPLATPEIVHTLTTSVLIPPQQLLIRRSEMLLQAAQEELSSAERAQGGSNSAAWQLKRLMNMFGELATRAGIALPSASSPQETPEEQFAAQLSQLQELGFSNKEENIRALIATAGDVRAAIHRLLGL